jgi:hypothetical protein
MMSLLCDWEKRSPFSKARAVLPKGGKKNSDG